MADVTARIDVQMLMGYLDAAAGLLASSEPACVSSAGQRLAVVETRLGELVAQLGPVDSLDANWLLITRNDLSVHLSAAGTLNDEGLHGRAAAVLEGAINTVRSRLDGPFRG